MDQPVMQGAYIAPNATVVGDVTLQEDVSIWYGAVLRGDSGAITVGKGSNIQEHCVLHEKTVIGNQCTVGHGAIVHGCTVGDRCLIGMGAIILDGAVLGDDCIVGAGALVTGKMNAPAGSVLLGSPAKVVKEVSDAQKQSNLESADHYIRLAKAQLPKR